jgi:predicted metal-dependent peptidase
VSNNKTYIQQAIHYVLQKNAFIGNLLQELSITISDRVPTAALSYDKKRAKFEVIISDKYFQRLTLEQRMAVFFHELLHFTHGHVFRFESMGNPKEHMLRNIAADMSINQYIQGLPAGCSQCPPIESKDRCKNEACPGKCIDVKDWKDEFGSPFPPFQSMEVYFDLLKRTTKDPNNGQGDGEGDSENEGDQEQDGDNGQQQLSGGSKPGRGKGKGDPSINWDKYSKYQQFDPHDWDDLSEEEKERMLQESKELVQRTIEKTFRDHSLAPGAIKELLQDIEAKLKQLDYKGLLREAIKRTISASDRESTWYRPNKRYGTYAPGTTNAKHPYINFYIDMSGSISHTEANEFKGVMDGFLQHSAKYCNVGFWHTELYQFRKYKRNEPFKEEDMQSGGTEPKVVLDHIKKNHPNLSIILTDGCYSGSNIKVDDKVIWIISANGTPDHQYKHIGITIKLEHLL